MDQQKQKLESLKEMISSIERTLFAARSIIAELSGDTPLLTHEKLVSSQAFGGSHRVAEEGKIVEGAFNGVGMTDDQGTDYPVPANYASKSKIVVGDKMKLTIMPDGKFVYKQIGPVPRRNILGPLVIEDGQYKVLAQGREYKVLTASVTFHKASVGDEVSILLPEGADTEWGAFDAVIPRLESGIL